MPNCAAFGCSNRSEKGLKLYRFPTEKQRRQQWVINVRRKDWQPSGNSFLCEVHFEESQFEANRADGWRKLKPNAVPTLFNIPNPPRKINPSPRKSVYKRGVTALPKTSTTDPSCARITFEDGNCPPASLGSSASALQKSPHGNAGSNVRTGEITPSTSDAAHNLADTLQECLVNKTKVDHSYSRVTKTPAAAILSVESTTESSECAGSKPLIPALTEKHDDRYLAVLEENKRLRQQLEDAQQSMTVTLEKDNASLRAQLQQANAALESFLSKDQIKCLEDGRMSSWLTESIIKALKFRFALGVHGYNFLRETGYPLPSYPTLMRRLREFQLTFGIFTDILEPLKFKVDAMSEGDRFCILSYDEMMISEQLDFDKSTGKFYGSSTLGEGPGQKIFTVVARGVRGSWKQIIACHVTPRISIETDLIKDFIIECIIFVETCGLFVVALSSDLDNRNRNLWSSLGISVTRDKPRVNSFLGNGHDIFAIPDVCHLLKNLKASMLRQTVHLPAEFVEFHNLPSSSVRGSYVVDLWNREIEKGCELRKLHHLRRQDVEPTHYDKMNVGAAVRFFSLKTAAALEIAVKEKILPEDAFSTAFFIRLIHEWFDLVSSKVRKTSITLRNCDRKYIFLHSVIDLFQGIIFDKHWKPLNYGVILATLSFCDVVQFLFSRKFDFVLGHRFTQDATENIYSQVRRREGALPTALQCLRALKGISVAQFVSDVKRTNYFTDSDAFLIDFFHDKKTIETSNLDTTTVQSVDTCSTGTMRARVCNASDLTISTYSVDHLCETLSKESVKLLFHMTGSTTHAVLKHVCESCGVFLLRTNFPANFSLTYATSYTVALNCGGLKQNFCYESFTLVLHCEYFYRTYKDYILRNGFMQIVELVHRNVDVMFPLCCNVKYKIIKHVFTIRSYCVKSFSETKRKSDSGYGSASSKRKKV